MSCECLVSPYKPSKKSVGLECLCYIQKFCVLQILIVLQKFIPLITLSVLTINVVRHLQGRNPVRHGKECSFLLMNFTTLTLPSHHLSRSACGWTACHTVPLLAASITLLWLPTPTLPSPSATSLISSTATILNTGLQVSGCSSTSKACAPFA